MPAFWGVGFAGVGCASWGDEVGFAGVGCASWGDKVGFADVCCASWGVWGDFVGVGDDWGTVGPAAGGAGCDGAVLLLLGPVSGAPPPSMLINAVFAFLSIGVYILRPAIKKIIFKTLSYEQ